MKIQVNRQEALALAKAAESIAPGKAVMDELRCVLLEAGEDNTLTMAATNMEVALERRMQAQVREGGSLLMGAKLFVGMLSLLGGETVTIQNLEVVKVDPELNMLVVRGAIPGPKFSLVTVKNTVKTHKVKQAGAGISSNPQKASGRNPQKASARTK